MSLKKAKSKNTVGKNVKEFEKSYSKKKDGKKTVPVSFAKEGKAKKVAIKKGKINENFMILGFIKSLVEKRYSEADKYLQGQVDKLVSAKIANAVNKPN